MASLIKMNIRLIPLLITILLFPSMGKAFLAIENGNHISSGRAPETQTVIIPLTSVSIPKLVVLPHEPSVNFGKSCLLMQPENSPENFDMQSAHISGVLNTAASCFSLKVSQPATAGLVVRGSALPQQFKIVVMTIKNFFERFNMYTFPKQDSPLIPSLPFVAVAVVLFAMELVKIKILSLTKSIGHANLSLSELHMLRC